MSSRLAALLALAAFACAPCARAQYGIDEAQYIEHSAMVLPQCAAKAAVSSAFVACYKQDLLQGR